MTQLSKYLFLLAFLATAIFISCKKDLQSNFNDDFFEKFHCARARRVFISATSNSYEFRTTVVKSLVQPEDFSKMAELCGLSGKYRLQRFIPRGNIIDKKLLHQEQYTDEDIQALQRKWGRLNQIIVRHF